MKDISISRKRLQITSLMFIFAFTALTVQQIHLQESGFALTSESMVFFWIFLLAMACEFVDTTLGMGYGTSLAPILFIAGFQPSEIVPSILASELITGGFAAYMHRKDGNFDLSVNPELKRGVGMLVIFSFAGALFAVLISFRLTGDMWKYIIALIIFSMGVIILSSRKKSGGFKMKKLIVIGLIASINKGISGGGYGPIMTAGQVTSGVSSRNAVAVTSFTEFFTSMVAFTAFAVGGVMLNYSLMLPLILGAVCVVPFATLTVKKVKDEWLKMMVGILTLLLGSVLILKTLFM